MQKGFCESFNGRMRDELLNESLFLDLDHARSRIANCIDDGTVGNLVRGAGFPSGSDEAIAEHNGELGLSLGPFAGRHFPLLSDLAQDQENELGRRLVAGEMASRPHGPSQLGVQGLDSIRSRYESRRRQSLRCGRRACGVWCDHPGQRRREHESVGRPIYSMS
jgi:Integrase core domain